MIVNEAWVYLDISIASRKPWPLPPCISALVWMINVTISLAWAHGIGEVDDNDVLKAL